MKMFAQLSNIYNEVMISKYVSVNLKNNYEAKMKYL